MSVHIVDEETKEVQYITFFYGDPIDEGDRLTVQYLPNLKFGVLIERNGEITGKRIPISVLYIMPCGRTSSDHVY